MTRTGSPNELSELSRTNSKRRSFDRATQGQYPPGSTFKVVTAAAGLDSGTITPETTINAPGALDVQGQPLQNDFNEDFGADHPRHGADQLGQHLVRPARRTGRRGRRCSNTWKRSASTRRRRSTCPPIRSRRAASSTKRRAARPQRPGRHRPASRSARSGCGDAAADGRGGGRRRQRGQADEAADLEPGGRPRRAGRQAARPLRVQPADQRGDRRRADDGDGRRGQRRDRHQRGDLRASRSPARPAPRKRPATRPAAAAPKRTRPGSSASPRPTTRRSRSRRRSSARAFGNDVAAPIFRDVAETILNGE